ncbi:MAG: 16S rRNA (uracil(1498)-N(3))-methyltransferase [Bowdeniella nasicola]|nr:16S rRNA (uracil(1498)-N(3))-methyltransferase [Bowdeniella nasicola]
MTPPVFLDPNLEIHPVGSTYHLGGPDGHHCVIVRRFKPGAIIDVVNGNGVRLRGEITAVETKPAVAHLRVQHCETEAPASQRIWLIQALATGGRDERAIEMATELGVWGIIPWAAARCTASWPAHKAAKRRARWQKIVAAATKQSRRSYLPQVSDVHTTAQLVARSAHLPLVVLDASATTALASTTWPAEIGIIVGPEGGITAAEIDQLRAAGATPARLGPHILRTSTAGPAALAVLSGASEAWR